MGLIYIIGIKLSIILKLICYRKKVIDNNLKNSFPKKDKLALRKIKNQFYSYLGQLIAESIKLFHCSEYTIKIVTNLLMNLN